MQTGLSDHLSQLTHTEGSKNKEMEIKPMQHETKSALKVLPICNKTKSVYQPTERTHHHHYGAHCLWCTKQNHLFPNLSCFSPVYTDKILVTKDIKTCTFFLFEVTFQSVQQQQHDEDSVVMCGTSQNSKSYQ
ncbi:hypothetical protein E2C01_092166 [Portunus trituberculatus]|uniref:Uncharacterized protein n=1 Tax=Portunus trituberculatus TaxID=210409 RepID=A0A5B7JRA8_PORTR|nr:hypothetical protein [Portunus trituberculatus]